MLADDFSISALDITIPIDTLPTIGFDCITATTIDDNLLEGNEMFTIVIDGTDDANFIPGAFGTATININDNEGTHNLSLKLWSSGVLWGLIVKLI